MGSGGVFASLLEHSAEEAGSPLFQHPVPWPLRPAQFDPNALQRRIAGQAGAQAFFLMNGRPFCLYVVLGSYRQRAVLTPVVNQALASVSIG